MPTFEIQDDLGNKYDVDAPDMHTASQGFSKFKNAPVKDRSDLSPEEMRNEMFGPRSHEAENQERFNKYGRMAAPFVMGGGPVGRAVAGMLGGAPRDIGPPGRSFNWGKAANYGVGPLIGAAAKATGLPDWIAGLGEELGLPSAFKAREMPWFKQKPPKPPSTFKGAPRGLTDKELEYLNRPGGLP